MKRVKVLSLILVLSLSMSACGDKKNEPQKSANNGVELDNTEISETTNPDGSTTAKIGDQEIILGDGVSLILDDDSTDETGASNNTGEDTEKDAESDMNDVEDSYSFDNVEWDSGIVDINGTIVKFPCPVAEVVTALETIPNVYIDLPEAGSDEPLDDLDIKDSKNEWNHGRIHVDSIDGSNNIDTAIARGLYVSVDYLPITFPGNLQLGDILTEEDSDKLFDEPCQKDYAYTWGDPVAFYNSFLEIYTYSEDDSILSVDLKMIRND